MDYDDLYTQYEQALRAAMSTVEKTKELAEESVDAQLFAQSVDQSDGCLYLTREV